MTEPSQPSPQNPGRNKGKLKGTLIGLLLLTGVGGVVYWYGQDFVYRQLSPLISKQLAEILNRPVQIGEVKGVSLNHIEFGPSQILPTKEDPAKITIPKIVANFNPIQAVMERRIDLKITAVRPEVLLQQDPKGNWLATAINMPKPGKDGPVKIDFKTLEIEDAAVTLIARDQDKKLKPPVEVQIKNGQLDLLSGKESKIDYSIVGTLASQGNLKITGQTNLTNPNTTLNLVSSNLPASEVSKLIPFAVALTQGTLNTDLSLNYNPKKPLQLGGTAQLNQLTAQLKQLPQPVKNVQGTVKFAQSSINLQDGVSAEFGNIKAKATGNLDLIKGYQVNVKTEAFSLQNTLKSLKIKAPALILEGKAQAQAQVTGKLEKPDIALQVQSSEALQVDKVLFNSFQLAATLKDSKVNLQQWQARPKVGGLLQGNGQANLADASKANFNLNFSAQDLPADSLAQIYAIELPTKIGMVQAQGQIKGNLEEKNQAKLTGQVQTSLGGGKVNLNKIQYETKTGKWQTDVQAEKIQIASLNVPIKQGEANANLQVKGSFQPDPAKKSLEVNGQASLSLPQGRVNIPTLSSKDGKYQALIETNNLQVAGLLPSVPSQIQGKLNSNIRVFGTLEQPKESLKAQGRASLALNQGAVVLRQISVDKGRWKTQIQADNIAVAPFVPKIPGEVDGNFNLTGTLDDPLKTIEGNGSALLNSSKGKIRVDQVTLSEGNFQAKANLKNIRLASLSPQLRGNLNGDVQLQGSLAELTPQAIKIQGDLAFSQGVSVIDRPLDARFNWQGKRLELQKVSATGLDVKGWLDIDATKLNQGISALGAVSLDIVAQRLNLQKLVTIPPTALAKKINYQGWLDFTGAVRGTLKAPYVEGKIALERAVLGPVALEKSLQGEVRVNPNAGIKLNLNGQRDIIAIALDPRYQLQAANIQLEPVKLRASKQQQDLDLQVDYLSLGWLKELLPYSPVPIPQNIKEVALGGDFSGNFRVNLAKQELISSNLKIANPLLGPIKADLFSGYLSFVNGNLTFSQGLLKVNQTEYQLDAKVNTRDNLAYQASAKIKQGQIQDVLQTVQIFDISDLTRGLTPSAQNKAKSLYREDQLTSQALFNVGDSQTSVLNQLRRYSELKTLYNLGQQRAQQRSIFPELSTLKGNFDAVVNVKGSLKEEPSAQFNFNGANWQWSNLNINEVLISGDLVKGNLRLQPARIQVEDSIVAFAGTLGKDRQTGELQLVKIPLSLIESLAKLPPSITIGGVLNAKSFIGGSRDNPKATGEIVILNANVNQTPIESAQATFNYDNSSLSFLASSTLSAGSPPLTLDGKFPYQLPFSTKKPASNQFALNVNLRNEGLMVLNILTKDQLRWLSGDAKVNVSVKGNFDSKSNKLSQLFADGTIDLQNASIAAQFLPDAPLTEVNAKIGLNFDRIDVQQLTAKFSGSEITVLGSLPLTQNSVVVKQPLTANFAGLAFNFKGLYRGGLEGKLVVTGTALNPRLGGDINLSDGQVFLGSLVGGGSGGGVSTGTESSQVGAAVEFDNLRLNLKNNIQLSQSPILNFSAIGGLTVNGSLDQLRPEGTIRLKNGLINLFATQFRLAGGEENTATFFPYRGLDPYLNIRLFASTTETLRNVVRTDNLSSEINDPFRGNADGLQTIRVEAKVEGYASQLDRSIQLSSVPSRSPGEIISLLGGGFINGASDPTVGLANLASSALLGGFQETLGSVLGLSEFRIFPTQLINSKDRTDSSQIGIALELGADISPSLFFSAQQILNVQRPTQFGLRYSINDDLFIRGSSNLSDDSRAVIQYNIRF